MKEICISHEENMSAPNNQIQMRKLADFSHIFPNFWVLVEDKENLFLDLYFLY